MATPNYGYEKRQRELAKKRKKEEKALRKTQGKGSGDMPDHAASEPPASDAPDAVGGGDAKPPTAA